MNLEKNARCRSITLRILLCFVAFAVLAVCFDGILALTQASLSPGGTEGVLRTFGENGEVQETRLVVVDDGDVQWIQSNHHFRGWYQRLLHNPEVEFTRNGETKPYRAVPVDTPESEDRIAELLIQRVGPARYYTIRTILLFADTKPVRLDPR